MNSLTPSRLRVGSVPVTTNVRPENGPGGRPWTVDGGWETGQTLAALSLTSSAALAGRANGDGIQISEMTRQVGSGNFSDAANAKGGKQTIQRLLAAFGDGS